MKFRMLLFIHLLWSFTFSVKGQSLKNTYRFYESLRVASPECGPDLIEEKSPGNCNAPAGNGTYIDDELSCGGAKRKVYHTSQNQGLTYPNSSNAITNTYTIQLYVKFTRWGTPRSRLIDFSNGTSDDGIYFNTKNGSGEQCLDFSPQGISGPCPFFNNDSYYLITITRDGASNQFEVYVNEALFLSYNDSNGRYAVGSGTPIRFFQDDAAVPCESGEVNLAYLSITSQYATPQDVKTNFNSICYTARVNSYPAFVISPNPGCSILQNIDIAYIGEIPSPGTGFTFTWDWDGGRVVSGSGMGPFVVNWNTPGTKKVTLTVKNNDCGDENYNIKDVFISSLNLETSVEEAVCSNDIATITINPIDGRGPFEYSVDSVKFQNDPVFKVDPGSYRVFIRDADNCIAVRNVHLQKPENLYVNTISDTTVCEGQQVKLFTDSNADTFAWLPSAGLDDANAKEPVAAPVTTTQYTVNATRSNCLVQEVITVFVVPTIEVTATPDTSIPAEIPFQLTASSPQLTGQPGVSYLWMPPIGLDQNNIASPVTSLKSDQKYFIKITSQEGCSGTAQVQLTVIPPHWIYVPDAFSPNGDGKNEILQLHHKGIKSLTYFQIYNRWGQVVFSTDQLDQGWNGKSTDTESMGGTYHFKMEAITDKGNKIFKSGNILLLR